eukprot:CAMPEP_0197447162 /NCGR_PEP_ID=MMETSP1175-20131217/12214_1 /TAXON_ID=1003142 /ORGANISM="Triceratium dubium, Strain CCMP147" /LENGTH=30 /DNA_ID= /DNA_START= /DNA_END= /DNA_ORIENTATION=
MARRRKAASPPDLGWDGGTYEAEKPSRGEA